MGNTTAPQTCEAETSRLRASGRERAAAAWTKSVRVPVRGASQLVGRRALRYICREIGVDLGREAVTGAFMLAKG